MNTQMMNMYIHNEKIKQTRMAWDNNYVPEVVVDEYSSSEYFSSEESDEYAEDPEDDFNEL
jgi:ribonuclease HIII